MFILFQNILLAMLYMALGWGAWYLAVPPHYASFFWPPAGIALAYAYLYGYRVLPGVFIGAALLSIFSPAVEVINTETYLFSLSFGIGPTVQAFFGVYLLRRFFKFKTCFHTLQSIVLFSALGVLSCLVSATAGYLVIYLKGGIDLSGFVEFWQAWFLGDVLGVLVVAPLIVLLFNLEVSAKRKLAVLIPVLVIFLAVLAMFINIKAKDHENRLDDFQRDVGFIQDDLMDEFDMYRYDMEAVHSLYKASNFVDRNEFETFVEHAFSDDGGIHAIGWVPYILKSERDVFIKTVREIYGSGFNLSEIVSAPLVRESGVKDFYTPVLYVSPFEIAKETIGVDLSSHPVRREAILRAKRTGEVSASQPIVLVEKEDKSDIGFILVNPLFVDNGEVIKGFIVGAFEYSKLVEHAISQWQHKGIEVSLNVMRDGQFERVYNSQNFSDEKAKIVDDLVLKMPMDFAGQQWNFKFYVEPEFYYGNINYAVWYILIAALICLYFLSVFLITLTGQGATMEAAVAEKTKELSSRNKFLKLIMDTVPDMIFVKDRDLNIVAANKAFFEMYAPNERDNIIGASGLENFPDSEKQGYMIEDRKVFEKGFSEVEEDNTTYSGIMRRLLSRKVRFLDDDGRPYLLGYSRDITDITNTQRKLEAILDTTADGLITINENGLIETYNKACERIFGYSAEEVIGLNVKILMTNEYAHNHDSYLEKYMDTGEKHIIGKGRELVAKRKDGSTFPIDLSVAEVELGGRRIFSGIVRDVTERKRAEELSQQVAQIFSNASIEFYIFDTESFKFLFVNEGAVHNLRYSKEELLGHRPSDFVPAYAEGDKFYNISSKLLSGDESCVEFEMQHIRKDGTMYDVLANMQLTQFDGRPAFIASMLDVTERNKVVDELKRSNKELESFAYVTSHDLKAPLRHVSMSASYFKEQFGGQLDQKSSDLLDAMLNGTERMQEMIESLLIYSKVGREGTELTSIQLSDTVLVARQNLYQEIHKADALIECDPLPIVKADRFLILQLFQNLFQNSLKYAKEGIPPRIKVSALQKQDWVEISVADNGIGVEPEYADKIFQIFQRLHRDDEYDGVGIGLSICKRIVEFHGGSIKLDKNYVGGVRIVFTLPSRSY